MRLVPNRLMGVAIACVMSLQAARGQAPAQEKPLMAEQVFKNVQVLKGIPGQSCFWKRYRLRDARESLRQRTRRPQALQSGYLYLM